VKSKESQRFFSYFFTDRKALVASGVANPYDLVGSWEKKEDRCKSLGQVCTPPAVARLMARWVTSLHPKTILDPAVGVGNLLYECVLMHRTAKYFGIDSDKDTLHQAANSAPKGTELICADYLKSDIGLMDGIIANPPYVKAQYLKYSETDWRFLEERFGTRLDRLTNLYALFLLKIWEDLALHGRAAVIIPSEFLNANFGAEIKERLLRAIRPKGIAVFDTAFNVFNQAMTTSCILFIEKTGMSSDMVRAHKVHSVEEAEQLVEDLLRSKRSQKNPIRYVNLSDHKPSEKWLNVILTNGNGANKFARRVGDYFRCLRGIATGANNYFCLSKAEINSRGLSIDHFIPCITKATDVGGLVFTHDHFKALIASGRRCYLLNPTKHDPPVDKYLSEGESQGIAKRYLPSHRPVWYLPENRPPADIWVAVFSRESVKYILNAAGVRNLTCFHGLYCREKNEGVLALMTLFLNSSLGREAFFAVNRFYGDGLNKLEPKDVEAMPCPVMPVITKNRVQDLFDKLVQMESLSPEAKQAEADSLVAEVFDLRPEEVEEAWSSR
jgi:adenine-specific DNA-methyltransferase